MLHGRNDQEFHHTSNDIPVDIRKMLKFSR